MNTLFTYHSRGKLGLLALILILSLFSCQKDDDLLDENNNLVQSQNVEVIKSWNSLFLELEREAVGMRPNATARAIAYIHLAGYEALQPGMPDYKSNKNSLDDFQLSEANLPDEVNWQIVLNTTYSKVFEHFLYGVSQQSKQSIVDLRNEIDDTFSQVINDDDLVQKSREWGNYVAEQIILYSQTDLSAEQQILDPQPLSYEPPTGEGYWTYSAEPERALFPFWGQVRTFVLASPQATTTIPPMPYSEEVNTLVYNQMFEVYQINNAAKEEQDEDLWIAEFWSDDVEGMMISPPTRQLSIAQQLIEQYDLNLEEALVLLLKLGFALNDAAVVTWHYKYDYMVLRPSEYIREIIDASYQTNLFRLVDWPNPTFPSYPSGHSCFASSAAGVFINTFGNETNFTDYTHEDRTEFRGMPRTFNSFEQMAEENSYSRIPLGVHTRMDCDEGLRLGYEVSAAVNSVSLNN